MPLYLVAQSMVADNLYYGAIFVARSNIQRVQSEMMGCIQSVTNVGSVHCMLHKIHS